MPEDNLQWLRDCVDAGNTPIIFLLIQALAALVGIAAAAWTLYHTIRFNKRLLRVEEEKLETERGNALLAQKQRLSQIGGELEDYTKEAMRAALDGTREPGQASLACQSLRSLADRSRSLRNAVALFDSATNTSLVLAIEDTESGIDAYVASEDTDDPHKSRLDATMVIRAKGAAVLQLWEAASEARVAALLPKSKRPGAFTKLKGYIVSRIKQ